MNLWIDCEKKPITELLEFVVDNRGKSVPTTDKGHILIATNCIRNDHLYPKYEKIRYLSQETYETFFRSHPLPGDIIFVNKGTPGRVCLVPDPIDFCIAQDMIALRANKNLVDGHYLFAVLRSPMIQTQIHNTYVGDVIPHFKKQFMDRLLIPLPSMEIQKKIGEIYYTICDKIEVNRRINEQLEELAGALFKSWFVDFEPFKDGEFVDSELGMIPKGWKVGTLDEVSKLIAGGDKPEIVSPNKTEETQYPIYSNGIDNYGLYGYTNNYRIAEESVTVSARGTIGYVCLREEPYTPIVRLISIIPNLKYVSAKFIYHSLKTKSIMGTGTTQQQLTVPMFRRTSIIVPPKNIVDSFTVKVNSMFDFRRKNQQEITHLTTLRDTLLPKLMSGEIDVNEVEI